MVNSHVKKITGIETSLVRDKIFSELYEAVYFLNELLFHVLLILSVFKFNENEFNSKNDKISHLSKNDMMKEISLVT